MRRYRLIFATLFAWAAISCESATEEVDSSLEVGFYSNSIQTRTTYDESGSYIWEQGDRVKIYAWVDGAQSSYIEYSAAPRIDATKCDLVPATTEIITYPNGSGEMILRAYYPDMEEDDSDSIITFSIADQSDLGAIDLMIANEQIVNYSITNRPTIGFDFVHQLAQISINVKSADSSISDFSSLRATLNEEATTNNFTFYTTKDYNLEDGTSSNPISSTEAIELTCEENIITAILHPGYTYVLLRLYIEDMQYDCYFEDTLTSGVSSNYELVLGDNVIVNIGECSVGEWGDGGTNSSLTPSQGDESDLN